MITSFSSAGPTDFGHFLKPDISVSSAWSAPMPPPMPNPPMMIPRFFGFWSSPSMEAPVEPGKKL